MSVGIVEKIFKVKGERSRSCAYKSVNVVVLDERGVEVCLFNLKVRFSNSSARARIATTIERTLSTNTVVRL